MPESIRPIRSVPPRRQRLAALVLTVGILAVGCLSGCDQDEGRIPIAALGYDPAVAGLVGAAGTPDGSPAGTGGGGTTTWTTASSSTGEAITVRQFTITGYVRHATSREPMGAVEVRLVASASNGPEVGAALTSGEGRFFFENRGPGTYFLHFTHPDTAKFASATTVVTILRDGTLSPTITEVALIPKAPEGTTFTVIGTVLDGYTGGPLDYVLCTLRESSSIVSDYHGAFVFENVVAGDYRLDFTKLGYNALSANIQIKPDGRTSPASLTFRLVQNQEAGKGSIVGRCIDEATRLGRGGLTVRLYRMDFVTVEMFDRVYTYWATRVPAVKTTSTAVDRASLPPPYDEAGSFKLTHLDPTTSDRKYLLFIGPPDIGLPVRPVASWTTDLEPDPSGIPADVFMRSMIDVAANTSTYICSYELP